MSPRPCPLCGVADARLLRGRATAPYRAVACRGCGFVFVDPLPPAELLAGHYDAAYYAPWSACQRRARERLWRRRLEHVRRLDRPAGSGPAARGPRRLLDVGCAEGDFLDAARRAGYAVEGTELSAHAAGRARARLGVPVHVGELAALGLPAAAYDVVTMWHVLEHVRDPLGDLREVARLLRPGGLAVVAVPNVESRVFDLAYRLVKGRRPSLFDPADRELHLSHFSARTLGAALAAAGLRPGRVTLDAPDVDWRKRWVDAAPRWLHRLAGVTWSLAISASARKEV